MGRACSSRGSRVIHVGGPRPSILAAGTVPQPWLAGLHCVPVHTTGGDPRGERRVRTADDRGPDGGHGATGMAPIAIELRAVVMTLTEKVTCRNCQAANPAGQRFCGECGHALGLG